MRRSRLIPAAPRREAFTLVELLVVIGIIALLIGILLPSLAAARRQANATKCLTQLREIGNTYQYYAMEYRGYYPPAQLKADPGIVYSLHGTDFVFGSTAMGPNGIYWFNFLQKYVSRSKIGSADQFGAEAATVKNKSVFWGCPSWEGYNNDAVTGGLNRLHPGYGMNGYPTFTNNYPKATTFPIPSPAPPKPPTKEWAFNDTTLLWTASANHEIGFVKQKIWGKNGAERCLVADSRFWLSEAGQLLTAVVPPQNREANENGLAAETSIYMWRHGKPPALVNNKIPITGGKMAYNILYCDGHVATATEPKEAYKSLRMKFPG